MPPALDRLLASPSALRLLRSLVNRTELPAAYLGTSECSNCAAPRREFHSSIERKNEENKRKRKKSPIIRFGGTSLDVQQQQKVKERHSFWAAPVAANGDIDQNNASTWVRYLQQRERVDGLEGIREVWKARRNFDLPIGDTPDAEYLWATFIKAHDLIDPILSHAAYLLEKNGETYPRLYELYMSYWLPQESWASRALDFHRQFLLRLKPQQLPLQLLARRGRDQFTPKVYEAFMDLYRTSNETNVYDEVVPVLCAMGNIAMAQRWHTVCIQRGDLPSPILASGSVTEALAASISNPSDPEAEVLVYVNSAQGQPELNQDLLRRCEGRDTASMRFDDSFCARMFATRTFPPESIIKGLTMAGVNEIGPLAVRTMASRATDVSDLSSSFDQLKATGVTLQGSVFSLALEKFAREGRWMLVRSILDGDLHPDVYDDSKLQEKLLDFYLNDGDLKQAHRTLAILSLFHNNPSQKAWNLLLQAQIKQFAAKKIWSILDSMQRNEIRVDQRTLTMVKELLRPRQRGHRPGPSVRHMDDLRLVANLYITVLESGLAPIDPSAWSEILRRYGMTNRFRELRRIVLRLLCWYAPRTNGRFPDLPKPPLLDSVTERFRNNPPGRYKLIYYNLPLNMDQSHKWHPLRVLFPPSFQQGLIVWGFRQGLLPNAPTEQSMLSDIAAKRHHRRRLKEMGILQRPDWSVGLRLVVELRDLGLKVHPHTVVKALQSMFISLFGRGHSNVTENRIMEATNTTPYAEYVQEVNRIWGSPLFREPQRWGEQRIHGLAWHPRFERQVRHRQDFSLDEIIGTGWRELEQRAATDEAEIDTGVLEPDRQRQQDKACMESEPFAPDDENSEYPTESETAGVARGDGTTR